jgi:hypothetical protein
MKEFEDIVKVAYLVVLGVVLLIIISRFIYFKKTKAKRVLLQAEILVFRLFRYATIIVLPFFIFGIISFFFVLQRGNMFAQTWMKISFLILMLILLVSEMFYNVEIRNGKWNRIFNIVFLTIISITGFYLNSLYLQAITYPDIEHSVIVDLPFKGKWVATGAGATGLTNHHNRIKSQK